VSCIADTSGLYAVLDADDRHHHAAVRAWRAILGSDEPPAVTNYVVIETTALVQHRLGVDAVRTLHNDVLPAMQVVWVTPDDHRAAVAALLVSARRHLSLVDCTTFEVARRLGATTAFAFDRHFGEHGLRPVR
jgi:predicted nucleic acid-binding protein